MFVRVMFFKNGFKPLVASEKQKRSFNKLNIKTSLVENGYIDIDTLEDPTYIHLLLHSNLVEVFDGLYKIKNRQFRAMRPYALCIELGDKISTLREKTSDLPGPIGKYENNNDEINS